MIEGAMHLNIGAAHIIHILCTYKHTNVYAYIHIYMYINITKIEVRSSYIYCVHSIILIYIFTYSYMKT